MVHICCVNYDILRHILSRLSMATTLPVPFLFELVRRWQYVVLDLASDNQERFWVWIKETQVKEYYDMKIKLTLVENIAIEVSSLQHLL
jgi:hypothetical protein